MNIQKPMGQPTEQGGKNEEIKRLEEEKKIISKLFAEKEAYEKSTTTKRSEIKTIWDAYNGEMTDKNYPWESNKFIPKIRTEVGYIMPFIFSGYPEFEITPVGTEDKIIAETYDKIINNQTSQQIPDAFDKFSDWVLQSVVFGTSIIKVVWDIRTKQNEDGSESIEKDEPNIVVPNILDVYVNPLIPNISDQASVIERSVVSLADVRNNPAFRNTDKVKGKKGKTNSQYNSEGLESTDLDDTSNLSNESSDVEIYERWTKDRIITVAECEERVLLRDVPNPYGFIPYEKLVFEKDPLPNRFYGKGVGQNCIDLQAMYYDFFNQATDNLKNVANKMYFIRKGAKVNPRELISKPGGFIQVDDVDKDIKEIQQSDIKQSLFQMIEKVDDEHKRASGANDIIQGGQSSQTLGQDQMAQNNTMNRFDLVRRRLKDSLASVSRMIIQCISINLQDVDSPILRIFPQDEREMRFMLIKQYSDGAKYDVDVKGDTILVQNKDIVVKQLIDGFNLFAGILTPQEQRTWARRILELRGQQDIDELVAPDIPMQPGMPGPVDAGAMPPQNSGFTNQGIQNQTYGVRR